MDEEKVKFLKGKAKEIRKNLLTMIYEAQSGHPGGSLSLTDIVTALYYDELKIDPKNPDWNERDRVVLSKGHCCPVIYTALAMKGYFDMEHLHTLRQFGSILQGHPDMKKVPGIDMSSGSLGQGLSCGVGMAIAAKVDNNPARVFVLMGDGENNEGQVWEAAMTASKYSLHNLTVIVDRNRLQNDGTSDNIMPLLDLAAKWRAFGFDTVEINGNDMVQVLGAFDVLRNRRGKPKCIIANTIKGKGVSFMENVCSWHGTAPNKEEYEQAIKDVEAMKI